MDNLPLIAGSGHVIVRFWIIIEMQVQRVQIVVNESFRAFNSGRWTYRQAPPCAYAVHDREDLALGAMLAERFCEPPYRALGPGRTRAEPTVACPAFSTRTVPYHRQANHLWHRLCTQPGREKRDK